jgi:uncharacterized protein
MTPPSPRPFPPGTGTGVREIVLKLHERCNLACDHCYMYESADQHWRERPVAMADATIDQVARRLGEHVRRHGTAGIRVVLHGGEPLLAGPATVARTAEVIRRAVPPTTRLTFSIQTNGILLNHAFLATFQRYGIRVGVSLDGARVANDRHRRDASGRSTYDDTVRAIALLRQPAFRALYGGLLCTVDLRNDPVGTYLELIGHEPPMVDFLLPHGNWVTPPPGLDPARAGTPYADWLIAVFDRWYGARRRETGVRLFESILIRLVGGSAQTEALGLDGPVLVTIESDGSIEGSDALKTVTATAARTGLNIFDHSLDDALGHPTIAAGGLGLAGLGEECRRCPVVSVCGGGLRAHRYSANAGYARASVYCADLFRLIAHIRRRVEDDVAALRRLPETVR